MPKRIARWNRARDVWETDATGLLCEHSDVFSETWPTSGMTRAGTAYALPTWAPRTDGSVSSSSRLLKTPTAQLGLNGGAQHPIKRKAGGHGPTLEDEVMHLLPTPTVVDMGNNKTPEEWDAWTARMKTEHGNGNGHGPSLNVAVQRLLPTPTTADSTGSGGSTPADVTLTDAIVRQDLGRRSNPRHGDRTPMRLPDGSESLSDPLPIPQSPHHEAGSD